MRLNCISIEEFTMRKSTHSFLLGGAAWAALAGVAAAQDAIQLAEMNTEVITVTATRQERRIDEVPATVTVKTAEEIEDELAADIKDLVRFEPGVSVRTAPSRFTAAGANTGRDGSAGFNIRGLDGNRVLILVDGVRVPDAFTFGGQSVGRGDYVDLDLLKSVEILRGPASSLYGSDGLAGAVSFTTRDPDDFLSNGQAVAWRARVAYGSADESWTGGLVGAFGGENWSAMIAHTQRDAHETETQGENSALDVRRTTPNPQDIETASWLGKIVFRPNAAHRFRFTAEQFDRDVTTEVYSARAVLPTTSPTATLDLDAVDTIERSRYALDYRFVGDGVIDRALGSIYFQDSKNYEFAAEDRNTAADRLRINTFDNAIWGAALQAESDATMFGVEHNLVYGVDYSLTQQEGVRDGTIPPVGEIFPTKAFPNTDYTLAGVYLQDEIRFLDGAWTLLPGVRYDHYEISPEAADPTYTRPVAEQSDGRASLKLGTVYWATPTFGGFASASQGYKTPSPSQVNNGFFNAVAFYQTISNPDLKPETSVSFETGLRMRDVTAAGGTWSGQIVAFYSQYEDFIEQVFIGGTFGSPTNPATYQYVNLSEVEIKGVELSAQGEWANGFGVRLAASWTEGEQTTEGAASNLQSVDPWKVVAGLSYMDQAGRFGGQLVLTHVGERDDVPAGGFVPEAFTIIDLTTKLNLTPSLALRAGVFNLTDETYWWWSDVRGSTATSTVLDAYTQPGRNVSISLGYRF
jgi:hemoglobin/transferrin/lactoferrin receptor protein